MMIAFDMRYGVEKQTEMRSKWVLSYLMKLFPDLILFLYCCKMRWLHDGKDGVGGTDGSYSLCKVQIIPHQGIIY